MQIVLARLIFETVFGPPSGTFFMVPVLDWSQGHAAQAADGLNAENMLVGNTGTSATHLRPTSWPPVMCGPNNDVLVKRSIECRPGCQECRAAYEASSDPNFQSIGKKGLKIVLSERGMFKSGMNQARCVATLQTCEDFASKHKADRAYVTEYLSNAGHVALFGTKYHAELMWIERKWMHLKRFIRGNLDGSLPKLKLLLKQHFRVFKVEDACKAARHCRTTMRAYLRLAADATLDSLLLEEKKMKGHRRVLDASDNLLKLKADVKLTTRQEQTAKRTEKKRLNLTQDAEDLAEFMREQAAKRRRKSKLTLTNDQKDKQKKASFARLHKSKVVGPKKQLTLKEMITDVFQRNNIK